MESVNFFGCVSLLLMISFLTRYIIVKGKKKNLPPSPRALPLIGHLHLLGKAPHESLLELARTYGPLMYLKLGMVPAIVVSNSTIARQVYMNEDLTFFSRPYLLAGEYLFYNNHTMSALPYSESKKLKKLSTLNLFSPQRFKSFTWVYVEELRYIFNTLIDSHHHDKTVDMRSIFSSYTFNVMTQMVCSKRYLTREEGEDKEAKEFKEIIDEAVCSIMSFHISEFFPDSLRWIGKYIDWSIPNLKRLHIKVDNLMQKILDEHKETHRACPDLTDTLMEECQNDQAMVKGTLLGILLAGTDSTAITSEWALTHLIHRPELMRKAQNELDANCNVGKQRMVDESDLSKLEYIQAVIKETFRIHSAILLPRASTRACNVGGYDVPKGSTLLVNTYALGRDESVWENPDVFMPERFIGSSVDVKGQNFELIPFGAGKRMCPGVGIALKTVQLVLANLLHGFDWSLALGKAQTLEPAREIINKLKTPLEVNVAPRLCKEAYA